MRIVSIGGSVVCLCALLCGMALGLDVLCRISVWLCAGMVCLSFGQNPRKRAALFCVTVCAVIGGMRLLSAQTGSFFLMPTPAGDTLLSAGESAYRTLCACLVAVIGCMWFGQMLLESLFSREDGSQPPVRATMAVRSTALLCLTAGMGACAVPGIGQLVEIPASVQTVVAFCGALATGAVFCFTASTRSQRLSQMLLLVYMASALFSPDRFGQHARTALFLSVLLCARGGRDALLWALPVPLSLCCLYIAQAGVTSYALFARPLWQAVTVTFSKGEMGWFLFLYARMGVWGYVLVGLFAGALLYLLTRLLRDSFAFAAPILFLLCGGSYILLCGLEALPAISDGVFFLVPYGLCGLAACMRRATPPPRRSSPARP